MKILKLHKLSQEQKSDAKALVNVCLEKDNLERSLYLENNMNFYEDLNSFYLLYEGEVLQSILTIFEPLETEGEITAYTLPESREKGYFTVLLDMALDELADFEIERVLFVVEPGSNSGLETMAAIGAEYVRAEYLLTKNLKDFSLEHLEERYGDLKVEKPEPEKPEPEKPEPEKPESEKPEPEKPEPEKPEPEKPEPEKPEPEKPETDNTETDNMRTAGRIHIQILRKENRAEANVLGGRIFAEDYTDTSEFPEDNTWDCFGAYLEHKLIGVCNVTYSCNYASIFGFGIDKAYRGKGFGRVFLQEIMAQVKDKGVATLNLAVSSDNKTAYSLYKSMGFEIKTEYDYYEYLIEWE